jgi:hypothetical protein
MEYEISYDENYFLSQLLIKLQKNESIDVVPYAWMPDHFDKNKFQAAYFKSCILANPELKIPNSRYYLSVDFTETQNSSINAWVDWLRTQLLPKFEAEVARKLGQEAQNRYQQAYKEKLEELNLKKRKRMEDKEGGAFVPVEDKWGRVKKPKLDDDGNTWREQK